MYPHFVLANLPKLAYLDELNRCILSYGLISTDTALLNGVMSGASCLFCLFEIKFVERNFLAFDINDLTFKMRPMLSKQFSMLSLFVFLERFRDNCGTDLGSDFLCVPLFAFEPC